MTFAGEPCVPYTAGAIGKDGYAANGAHRKAFVTAGGVIPPGMVIDHLCHDPEKCVGGPRCLHRRCVNPRHLAVVTRSENARRSVSANARKTHCPKGHEYTPENTRWRTDKKGRACRACCREASDRRRRAAGVPKKQVKPPKPLVTRKLIALDPTTGKWREMQVAA